MSQYLKYLVKGMRLMASIIEALPDDTESIDVDEDGLHHLDFTQVLKALKGTPIQFKGVGVDEEDGDFTFYAVFEYQGELYEVLVHTPYDPNDHLGAGVDLNIFPMAMPADGTLAQVVDDEDDRQSLQKRLDHSLSGVIADLLASAV